MCVRPYCNGDWFRAYCPIELATEENTLFAFPPISRRVPTTITRITAMHHGILGDVLALFLRPKLAKETSHLRASVKWCPNSTPHGHVWGRIFHELALRFETILLDCMFKFRCLSFESTLPLRVRLQLYRP